MRLTSPFNLPAPGRRQTLYVVFDFAESCVFSKQSLGPLYCNSFAHTTARIVHGNRAPLIPKLRGQFAEFLNEGSHSRLRIFSSPTCVGLRYGHHKTPTRLFLAAWDGPLCEPKLSSSGLGNTAPWILPAEPSYTLEPTRPIVGWLTLLRHPCAVFIVLRQYGNVDPFSIGYAFRPGLRTD